MTPIMQTRVGYGGNCAQAAVASILDLPLDAVPDLSGDGWWRVLQTVLNARGLVAVEYRPPVPIVASGDGMLALLSGLSPRGLRHMVVGRLAWSGWEIAHDPHPDGGGLDRID
jgi:hypothetical protein